MCAHDNLLDPSAAPGLEDLRAIGWLCGEDSQAPLGYCDPIDEEGRRPAGEGPRGIVRWRHPEAMLRDDDELWPIVDRFRCGVSRELSHEEFET